MCINWSIVTRAHVPRQALPGGLRGLLPARERVGAQTADAGRVDRPRGVGGLPNARARDANLSYHHTITIQSTVY
jgi:hypothetical protein